jgi:hypothetical protein
MLRSIERVVTQSGMAIGEVRIRHQEWGGNMRAEWGEDGYAVEPEFDLSDSRLLNPIARVNLEALGSYCSRWLPPGDAEQGRERIDDLIGRSERLSEVFEGWLAQRQTR